MFKSLGSVLTACLAAWIITYGTQVTKPARAQERGRVAFAARTASDLRDWGRQIDSMRNAGELRVRERRSDPLVPGRSHERANQYYRGVRVFGADVAQQFEDNGTLVSAFGTIYDGIAVDPDPQVEADQAARIVQAHAGVNLLPQEPELVILPLADGGGYALTWRIRSLTADDLRQYFVDASTGAIAFEYSDLQTQTAVIGKGVGVLGDTKKLSVTGGTPFTTTDRKRPPSLVTYDMRGNFLRTLTVLDGATPLQPSDVATDSDNDWSDPSVVDAHAYAGFTYDYYFKRFNRHGLDNNDISIKSLVNPVRRSDANTLFPSLSVFFTNAGYVGNGMIYYGVGLPPGMTSGGKTWDFTSGALDIVGHELTHGVTDFSSRLIYLNESGALNEAFSDIMGTSIEFFFQPAGSGKMQADYFCGEDVISGNGIRSLADPQAFGQPDHYSRRVITTADNGGVHINSGIANNAFYLAIEGGTNRTSGLTVQGVGSANRELVEKVFYRAFTQLMQSSSTFATARVATIQAARDLYPANSAIERAIIDAWTAVGVVTPSL